MAIVFDWYENPNASSEEEAALHPRIFMNGKVDTDTLCYKIHDYSSLTVGDVKNVLDNLSRASVESQIQMKVRFIWREKKYISRGSAIFIPLWLLRGK